MGERGSHGPLGNLLFWDSISNRTARQTDAFALPRLLGPYKIPINAFIAFPRFIRPRVGRSWRCYIASSRLCPAGNFDYEFAPEYAEKDRICSIFGF